LFTGLDHFAAMRSISFAALIGQVLASVDIIGYYGNSGNAVSSIPLIADVHPNYNVIILTFASIDESGNFALDIQGPYEKDMPKLASDIKAWKAVQDPFGRHKHALVSIGGQNGRWPSSVPASAIEAGLNSFMDEFGLDGLDIDLEGGAVSAATSLVPVIQSLTSKGKVVTAAPEASQGPLMAYKDMLKYLTWVHPQFYNNGPNSVTDPFVPSASLWPTPWTVTDWQAESGDESFWAGVLGAIGDAGAVPKASQGMLIPATPAAAGNNNHWDIDKLASQVKKAGVTHVGTWAIAYDNTQDWKFAKALGALCSSGAVIV
jgi:chitinase